MPRARVWSQTVRHKGRHGWVRETRYWCFRVTGWNGVVLEDNGFASWEVAFEEAHRLAGAVRLIERRGQRLASWKSVVDAETGARR